MGRNLRKTLKITSITLGSLIGLVVLAVCILSWTFFSSSRLTKVAANAIERYSPVHANVNSVDLTLIGSYPFLAFRLSGLTIYDEMEDSPYDTLAAVQNFTVTINLEALYKERKIIVTDLFIDGVQASLFTSASGHANTTVFMGSEADTTKQESEGMEIYADIDKVLINDVEIIYRNLSSGINATLHGLDASVKGLLHNDSLNVELNLGIESLAASVRNDSTDLGTTLKGISIDGDLLKSYNTIACNLQLNLNKSVASVGSMNASIDNLRFVLDDIACSLSEQGLDNLATTLSMDAEGVEFMNDGMNTSVRALSMRTPKAVFMGDSINLNSFQLDAHTIGVQLTDSLGSSTEAGLESFTAGLDGGVKLDLSNIDASVDLTLVNLLLAMDGGVPLKTNSKELTLSAACSVHEEDVELNSELNSTQLELSMNNELYLPGWDLNMTLPIHTTLNMDRFTIKDGAGITIDGEQIGFGATGRLRNDGSVSGKMYIKTLRNLDIDHLISMIPEEFENALDGIDIHGLLGLDIDIQGAVGSNVTQLESAMASISLQNLDAMLNDSLKAESSLLRATITYPSLTSASDDVESANVTIGATDLEVTISDSTTIKAQLTGIDLNASAISIGNSLESMSMQLELMAQQISGTMDTLSFNMNNAHITAALAPDNSTTSIKAGISFNELSASAGSMIQATLGGTSLMAKAQYDEQKTDPLLKWSPDIQLSMSNATLLMIQEPISIPKLDMDFSLGRFIINDCKVLLAGSDMQLRGDVYNIGSYIDGTGLLTGKLNLESDHVDVNRLMSLAGGSTSTSDSSLGMEEQNGAVPDTLQTLPFMVPKGMDLTLYTNLSEISFNDKLFNNVGGDVTIHDGVVVLQELGFSSQAAQMQLTAIYKTPSIEDRFMELDFHLLDIEIDELVDLIPAVDSIVPMLKSFSGTAQFHLAAETYLEPDTRLHGDYFPVMSTLIGAAAIEGQNLVILDNDVFDGIKKKLLMSKDAKNVVDSLDVEIQVLRDKVDLYPTRLKMDRYEAIVSGRHNINKELNCSYNISLTECPLPIRLGVTLSGPIEGIAESPLKHIKVGRPKYDKLYKPSKRGNTEEKVLQMKQNILETLRGNVRETPTP